MGAGFYGKLPSQGDFVTRRLPWEFTSGWDAWLQAGMSEAKQRLGDAWLDRYLTAPIWRFQLAAGVLGEVGWAGLWCPSVDRVGRHFPLTLATPLPAAHEGCFAVLENDPAFLQWEEVALQALDPRLGSGDFDALVEALPVLFNERIIGVAYGSFENDAIARPSAEVTTLQFDVDADAASTLDAARVGGSVESCFFSWGGEGLPPTLCRTAGLLPVGSFHAFFDGRWVS